MSTDAAASTVLSPGEVAAALVEESADGDLLFAAIDEARAVAIARALGVLAPEITTLFCPGSDALPGDAAPASPVNVGQRVAALRRLRLTLEQPKRGRVVLVTTGEALARAYPPPAAFAAEPPRVVLGEAADGAELVATLEAVGYFVDERVDEPGEVAWRGQVLDVFPADAERPLRVEIAKGAIASIREFDPADQRSIAGEDLDARELGRVSEPALDDKRVALLDHLPGARVAMEPGADDRRQRFLALAADAAKRRPKRAIRDTLSDTAWKKALGSRAVVAIKRAGDLPVRFVERPNPLRAFAKAAKAALADGKCVVLMGGDRDLRFLARRLAKAVGVEIAPVPSWRHVQKAAGGSLLSLPLAAERGFAREGVCAVAAADLLGSRAQRDDEAAGPTDTALFDLGEIRVGDVVVHEDHGIGLVAGLESIEVAGIAGDAIRIGYANDDHRLIPVAEADRLWRYGADVDAVALDRLDGTSWQKRRTEIDQAIAESARALTAMTEERDARDAPILDPEAAAYEAFAAGFPFSETTDQHRAIEAVRADLASGKPMDRLVIGDVGYGKTEVALRAAAIAALAGKQVAIAVPTTVLARQHLESFTARFEGSGIVVAGLSRLSTAAERKKVKAGLADGSIQVVVTAGAVAGKGVAYQGLALVVVDEEQRFGAADKGKLRDLSAGHILSLSATPIPRTLQSALVGLQQLSVIATPPARRQPIRTAVAAFDADMVRTALLREKSRGGQSFVVVPRIEDMAKLAATLETLVPELELLQAHGKMSGSEIDDAMVRFGAGDGDVLLATNIIEAGLDVPRANTMVIWRADRFGLSQLHQLRGRVGRGSRRGQVLLLTDPDHTIAPRTLKRLRTLEAFDRLGAGFAIAARDLDQRGAGDLLGETQAGHMKLIGIDLYQQLLEGALRTARGEQVERWRPELHLGLDGRLVPEWIPDEELRVTLYARLARLPDADALDAFTEELEDRFGDMPADAATLLKVARVRADAFAAKVARIDAGAAAIALTMRDGVVIDHPDLEPLEGRFLLRKRIEDPLARLDRVVTLLTDLAG